MNKQPHFLCIYLLFLLLQGVKWMFMHSVFSFNRLLAAVCMAFLLMLVGCNASKQTPELVQSQAWLMDKTGAATLEDVVLRKDWQPMHGWQGWGYGAETIWIRTTLKAAEPGERFPWIVRVRPAFLDYLTLYDPSSGNVMRSGDTLPPDDYSSGSINFTFQIPALPKEREIYLQLKGTSTRVVNLEVLSYGQAQFSNRLQEWLVGFFTATSGIFALWASVQWWVSRDRLWAAFALKQTFSTLWAFFFLGFARVLIGPYLSEGVLNIIASTVLILFVSVMFWFLSKFLENYQPAQACITTCRYAAASIASLTLLQFFDATILMLTLGNAFISIGFMMLLITAWTAFPSRVIQPISLRIYFIYLASYGLFGSLPTFIYLGLIPANSIMVFGNMAHLVLDGLVMLVLLQVRAKRLQEQQKEEILNLKRIEQKAETEKQLHEKQVQLFSMLAHELKTPLASLRMWMDAGQLKREVMERTIHDMNQVIERCVHTGQLTDQALQPIVEEVDAVLLTQSAVMTCRSPERVQFSAIQQTAPLQTDPQMLSIVLANLLDNACKYSLTNSPIQVSLIAEEQHGQVGWLWRVSNQPGQEGLPDESQIFEKYYRGPHARRQSGSGLGLFLVKGLLELLHGEIAYTHHQGQIDFTIWIPDNSFS